MNLLQVSPYVVEPPRTGGSHRTHGLVKEFPSLGTEVTRYCQGGSPDTYRNLDFRRVVSISDRYIERRHLNPIHDLAMSPVPFGFPNIFASAALEITSGPLDALLDDADLVLVRGPWQMPAILNRSDVPVVYSSHNVESERFERMSPALYNLVRNRVNELERRAVEESDATVVTSERDARIYRDQYEVDSPLFVAPNGTYRQNIRERQPDSEVAETLRHEYDIDPSTTVAIFVGSDYGPNIEAAEHIARIARQMEDGQSPVHFVIVGTVGDAISVNASNVTVTGFVDEFEGHFDLADLAINPMTTGGGTNIKLFDYFARSLPVVSTPFGVRGINVRDGEEVVIANVNDFPEAIDRLRSKPKLCERIGRSARQLVSKKYTWESISKDLHDQLETLCP